MIKREENRPLVVRMRELGYTYRTLAQESGIPLSTLYRKLNGYSAFDILQADRLCRALDVSPRRIAEMFCVTVGAGGVQG